jgi:hypothetical protein
MAAKKSTSKKASAPNKAAFVRAHANLSPKQIVAKAKTQGLRMAVSYVYNVRAYAKSRKKSPAKRTSAPVTTHRAPRKAPAIARPIATRTSAEDLLRAVAAEIGLGRAIEVLQGERARVHAVLRG